MLRKVCFLWCLIIVLATLNAETGSAGSSRILFAISARQTFPVPGAEILDDMPDFVLYENGQYFIMRFVSELRSTMMVTGRLAPTELAYWKGRFGFLAAVAERTPALRDLEITDGPYYFLYLAREPQPVFLSIYLLSTDPENPDYPPASEEIQQLRILARDLRLLPGRPYVSNRVTLKMIYVPDGQLPKGEAPVPLPVRLQEVLLREIRQRGVERQAREFDVSLHGSAAAQADEILKGRCYYSGPQPEAFLKVGDAIYGTRIKIHFLLYDEHLARLAKQYGLPSW